MEVLNSRGLAGLYEAIIQTSGREMFEALCAITLYLEACRKDDGSVVIHCVQGKDR